VGEDSLKKRYLFKLLANFVGFVFNIITQAIIPRGLGPKAYGDFGFLSSFFTQFVGFLDMGTSVCFYTKLSGRQRDFVLVRFYGCFAVIVSIITLAFVFIAHRWNLYHVIWPDQHILYIYLAAIWGILMWIVGLLTMMGDAYGLTVATEKARIIQRALGLALILLLFILGQIHLAQFFVYHYVILFFLAGVFIYIFERKGYSLNAILVFPSRTQFIKYFKEFYLFSHPLFLVSVFALVTGIFDRWILQVAGGSLQQGFYTLSYQIGAMCFLFTGAMMPLLLREFAIAHTNNDIRQMADLFRRYFPALFSISAFFSCFIALQADKVIYIFGGNQYGGAMAAVTIMAFYPIHQTYGQLSASLFYATGQTALYRNIGMIFLILGLPLTYFLIAPVDKLGLNAGATGLAIKMVLLNVIGVNVQLYFNAKQLNLRFWRYLGYQVSSLICLLVFASLTTLGADYVLALRTNLLTNFLVAGLWYSIMVIGLAYFLPAVFGISRDDINLIQARLKSHFKCA
jgi:O-antigen/teichoic acid export membrane protein